jgi:D-alanine transaminase
MVAAMPRIAFLNGEFLPYEAAKIPIGDRGFLFADGIYEVSAVLDGRLVDNDAHLARLERCLAEIRIANPHPAAQWRTLQEDLIRRNGLREGVIYMQVTRGVAERDFAFPKEAAPTVVMFTQEKTIIDTPLARSGARVVSVPDLRWARRDIKSVSLLAQVLAKQAASEAGAAEAWMVENGMVTEGGSSSAFVITRGGAIVTRPLSHAILPGITRSAVLALADEAKLRIDERAFSLAEAMDAQEAFFTSASSFVMPVVSIDGHPVGAGQPGAHTLRLRDLYVAMARELPAGPPTR